MIRWSNRWSAPPIAKSIRCMFHIVKIDMSVDPVSYTHLDVYKRQGLIAMLGLPSRRMHALVAHFIIRASAGQVVTDLFQALRAILEH